MKIKIPSVTNRNKTILGTLEESKVGGDLIIFISGLTGSQELPLFLNASEYFKGKDLSTLRFNFCSDLLEKNKKTASLKMEEMSFEVYIKELKNIIDFLSLKYSRITLLGHSFGAVVVVLFLSRFKSYLKKLNFIFWEPALLPWKRGWMEEDFIFNSKKKLYYSKNGEEVISPRFYEECIKAKPTDKTFKSFKKGTLVIVARGSADKDGKKYISGLPNSKFLVLDNTDHWFSQSKVREKLFKETFSFLKREK